MVGRVTDHEGDAGTVRAGGPAAVVADAFVDACRRMDRSPDHRLRLLAWHAGAPTREGGAPPTRRVDDPFALGELHEELATPQERRRRGAWYTPRWLAERLVAEAVHDVGVVADPACGGGAFLLAAADRLLAAGADPAVVVGALLWGADIDPLAVAVTEAALWWWSSVAGAPTVAGHRLVVGDALVDLTLPRAAAVVGNPPFLGQLKRSTTVAAERRAALQARWGPAMRPYTDAAWLFLGAAAEAVDPGGRVAMIQPQSLLAARDARPVRDALDRIATLESCWIDDGVAFSASVDVCAPVLRRSHGTDRGGETNDWTAALAAARGVPEVPAAPSFDVRSRRDAPDTLGLQATIVAGFRDEYYGLVPAVRGAPDPTGSHRPLVTVGAIDPLRRRLAPIRYAKQRWHAPVVDPAAIAPGRARRWFEVQDAPKLLVATQTRVVEAVPDPDGVLVGSVPAIVVVPADPTRLWHLAAALHAPVVSAWMLRRTAGTALASDACKPTAAALGDLPLPIDDDAWDEAVVLARDIAAGAERWDAFAVAADAAYGVDDADLRAWWRSRLPVR